MMMAHTLFLQEKKSVLLLLPDLHRRQEEMMWSGICRCHNLFALRWAWEMLTSICGTQRPDENHQLKTFYWRHVQNGRLNGHTIWRWQTMRHSKYIWRKYNAIFLFNSFVEVSFAFAARQFDKSLTLSIVLSLAHQQMSTTLSCSMSERHFVEALVITSACAPK